MPESKNSPDSDKNQHGLPADWALSRITPVAPRPPVVQAEPAAPPVDESAPQPSMFSLAGVQGESAALAEKLLAKTMAAAPAPVPVAEPVAKPEPAPVAVSLPVPKLLPQSAEPVRPNTLVDPRVFGAIGQWQKETPEHKPEPPASRSAAALSPVPLQAAPPAPVQPAEAPPPPSVAVPIVVEAAPVVAVPPAEPAPPVVAKPAEPAKPEPAKFEAKPRRAIHLPKLSGGVVAWKLATAFFALSSAVLAYALLDRPQGFDIGLAPIGIVNSPAPIFLVETGKTKLRLTSLADIEVPKENDLQLWMVLPNSERAISLGVLPASGGIFTPPQQPTEGTRFVVSLEPHGGTVSGKITGKVLYGGQLADR